MRVGTGKQLTGWWSGLAEGENGRKARFRMHGQRKRPESCPPQNLILRVGAVGKNTGVRGCFSE